MLEKNAHRTKESIKSMVDFDKIERDLKQRYHLGFIMRNQIEEATGGLLKARTMAARDCEGRGPDKIYIGNRVAYEIGSLVACMRKIIK